MLDWILAVGLAVSITGPVSDPPDLSFPGDADVLPGTRHVHDPSIARVGDTWVCVSTSGNSFGPIRTSTDLIHWTDHGPLLADFPAWVRERFPRQRSMWAPDITVGEFGVRIYYSVSQTFGRNDSMIGLLENPNFDPARPHDGWIDRGMVLDSVAGRDHFNAIDPELLIDQTGRHWLFWGSFWSGILVTELDPKTGMPKSDQRTVVAVNTEGNGNPIEAPALIYHDGYYYLYVSREQCCQGVRSTYHMAMGRSKEPTGPFVDRTGKPMTEGGREIVMRGTYPVFGPGHNDLFKLPDGRPMIAHHAYDARDTWHGNLWGIPTLCIRELIFDADGWPTIGAPITRLGDAINSPVDVRGTWIHQSDFARPMRIELLDDGVARGPAGEGRWTLDGRLLTITWPAGDGREPFIDRITISSDGNWYGGQNQNRSILRGSRMLADN